MASHQAIAELAVTLGALYGDKFSAPTPQTLTVWYQFLEDVTDDEMRAAFDAWDGEWPMMPPDIRRHARGNRPDERRYLDRSHREYDSQEQPALEAGYPDPLASLRRVKAAYEAKFGNDS
jgi:hypothetical protein